MTRLTRFDLAAILFIGFSWGVFITALLVLPW